MILKKIIASELYFSLVGANLKKIKWLLHCCFFLCISIYFVLFEIQSAFYM